MKKFVGLFMALVALGLLVPGILMMFSYAGVWDFAAVLLAVFIFGAAAFSIVAAILSGLGHKKASALFICAGIFAVLDLALTLYLTFSIELTSITTAICAIVLFVGAKVVSAARE